MQPMILLTASRETGAHSTKRAASELYGEAIWRAGGIPVTYAGGDARALAARLDGLLLTGGGDVAPERYGAERLPTDEVDEQRDAEEFALLTAFLVLKKPVFGICRGIQVLNVQFGGTLAQDIPGHADGVSHMVQAAEGSRLARVCGAAFRVNSWHHQAVGRLGAGLRACGVSPDGTVEAVRHESLPVSGVQWHPERMIPGLCADVETGHLCLFTDFIKECESCHESTENGQSGNRAPDCAGRDGAAANGTAADERVTD